MRETKTEEIIRCDNCEGRIVKSISLTIEIERKSEEGYHYLEEQVENDFCDSECLGMFIFKSLNEEDVTEVRVSK